MCIKYGAELYFFKSLHKRFHSTIHFATRMKYIFIVANIIKYVYIYLVRFFAYDYLITAKPNNAYQIREEDRPFYFIYQPQWGRQASASASASANGPGFATGLPVTPDENVTRTQISATNPYNKLNVFILRSVYNVKDVRYSFFPDHLLHF